LFFLAKAIKAGGVGADGFGRGGTILRPALGRKNIKWLAKI